MSPHETADSPTKEEETLVFGKTIKRKEASANAGGNLVTDPSTLSTAAATEDPAVVTKTIASMGRPDIISLVDLEDEHDEHDLVPVHEYYCTPINPSSISFTRMKSMTPTTATSVASSISSSFSSTPIGLLNSSSSSLSFYAVGGGSGDEQEQQHSSDAQQLEQHQALHLIQQESSYTYNTTQQQQQQQDEYELPRRRIPLSPRTKLQNWEVCLKPILMKYLHDEQLLYFYKLYHDHDIKSPQLLESLAYLASSPSFSEECYWDHLCPWALYWSSKRKARTLKLITLKTLMQCLSPPVAGWQHCDPVIEGTLDFLITPQMEWEFMDHSEMNLLLELRAVCLRFSQQEEARIAKMAQRGDTAAVLISASAKLMEEGMIQSGRLIEGQLDKACVVLKTWVKPGQYPINVDQNHAYVARALSSAAKRASIEVKDSTVWLVQTARDASSKGLGIVVEKLDNKGNRRSTFHEQLSPESAEALKVVGKVGMATLGATALVGEAMVELSRGLVRKTGSVAADIVEHKYGSDAGRVVLDASETADNLVQAAGNVALLEHKVMAKTMAKDAGKEKIEAEMARAKDSMHLLEIQMAGIIHQALGNGPGPNKLLEGMKGRHQQKQQTQLVKAGGTPSPAASTTSTALKRTPSTISQVKTSSESSSQQAVMLRV